MVSLAYLIVLNAEQDVEEVLTKQYDFKQVQ